MDNAEYKRGRHQGALEFTGGLIVGFLGILVGEGIPFDEAADHLHNAIEKGRTLRKEMARIQEVAEEQAAGARNRQIINEVLAPFAPKKEPD